METSSGYTGLVIGPIITESHYTLAVGDVQSHQIRVYNSLETISTDIKKALDTLNSESQVTWTQHEISCEQQNVGTSCGVSLCWYALSELARRPRTQNLNVQLSRYIFIVLLGGELPSFTDLSHQPKEIEEAIHILRHIHDDLVGRRERLQER